ncbi:hypothetical protein [Pontibacter sp. G13]|uniref:hypothetical protein n=1 Tax=Pontibacter sp. G13 TaxID=3074898 RepID=UPI002889B6CE|nr:hypothetical protein [Pontibacter sp. G13]WNJ18063.1 hypothetical protein RJD25_24670 [Pontibacter sp. G13]
MNTYLVLLLILDGGCLLHIRKHRNPSVWYWVIVLLPILGVLLYWYEYIFRISAPARWIAGMRAAGKAKAYVRELEQQVAFNPSVYNRTALADAYTQLHWFDRALELYESCLEGIFSEDEALLQKSLAVHHLKGNHQKVVEYGELLKDSKGFKDSVERIGLAWSCFHLERHEDARAHFKEMDILCTNYLHRLEFVRFYEKMEELESAKKLLHILEQEFQSMPPHERILNAKIEEVLNHRLDRISQ